MSIYYCAIACGKRVLCEQSVGPIDFSSTLRLYLDISVQEYVTFTVGRNTYNSYNRNGLSYVAIADASTSQQQTLSFLRSLEAKYTADSVRILEAHSGSEYCHQINFGRVLLAEMANFSRQDQEKVLELRGQVTDISGLMQKNIANLNERGTKLDDLFTKTEALESNASMFRITSRQVKQKHYRGNFRIKVLIIAGLFVLFFVIVLLLLWQTGVLSP